MYNSDDATMQTITIVNSHYITEGQYVACIIYYMYKDETGHISNFLVRNLIVVLQWRNKGGEGKGKWVRIINIIIHYMCIFGLLPV